MDDARAQGIPIENAVIVFSLGQIPSTHDPRWREYRKKVPTRAIRINGPFRVETSEGPLTCQDGYLAVDARGYPYPIAADEFELIYQEVTHG